MQSQNLVMQGRAAMVTGAASGVGRAVAVKLAQAGADLCLVDLNEMGLAETASMISGTDALIYAADLADPDACHGAVEAATLRFGRLDALCNVAGMVKFAHSHQMPRADWDKTIAVNLSAPFFLSQAAIPHLLGTNGAIVNVASFTAFAAKAYVAAYCASKAGLVHMTKAMAMEYMNQPIRINAVAPGAMDTGMGSNIPLPENVEPGLMQRFASLRGNVEVEDVADMVAFLASPAGRAYHGACISIDAGLTAG